MYGWKSALKPPAIACHGRLWQAKNQFSDALEIVFLQAKSCQKRSWMVKFSACGGPGTDAMIFTILSTQKCLQCQIKINFCLLGPAEVV